MPGLNAVLDSIPLSVFETLNQQIARNRDGFFAPLHQGKTTFAPAVAPGDWRPGDFELRAHEHAPPGGIASLRARIAEHLLSTSGREVPDARIIVTCGATHALSMVLGCILHPGEEVLLLSPQWLFAAGVVEAAGGRAVEVPVFLELSQDRQADFVAALEDRVGPRTRALYFNSPNNPTGFVFDAAALDRLAEFAQRHDLWILSDNAYENYDFTDESFRDVAERPAGQGRTVSLHTFSKTYAMPGYRVGYAVVPELMAVRMRKWSLYSTYAVPTSSQYAAFQALTVPAARLRDNRLRAMRARDIAVGSLAVPHQPVEGGLYALLDLSAWPGTTDAFISRCIRAGVSLAPGAAFGRHCEQHARLCFTAVDEERLHRAIDRINDVYGG